MKPILGTLVVATGLALVTGVGVLPATAGAAPTVRTVAAPGTYPEGVAWDPTRGTFLVGSATHGTVSVVRNGTVRTLVHDPRLVSTFGLTVDAPRNRILVAYGDIGLGDRSTPDTLNTQAGLGVFDLRTGRTIALVDLAIGAGPHASNDVTVDPRGNVYVTDVLAGAVTRVDTRYRVTARITDPRFASPNLGMNGIVWHPDGVVLAVRYDTGTLFRITPAGRVSEVRLDAPLVGGDGLAVDRVGALVVVTNALGTGGPAAVRVLRAARGWDRATVTRTVAPWPDGAATTVAATPSGTWVLNGHLDALLAGDRTVDEFTLRRL